MNDFFNLKRFWLVLRRELCLSTKPLIIGTVIVVCMLVLDVTGIYKCLDVSYTVYDNNVKVDGYMIFLWLLAFVLAMAVLVSSAQISQNLAQKTSFLAFNTLPASTFERYLARVSVFSFLPLLVGFAFYFGIKLHGFIPLCWCVILLSTAFVFWGAVFRRYGFIIGFCVTAFSVFALFRWILPNVNLMFLDPIGRFVQHDFFGDGRLYLVLTVVLLIVGVINFGAGYFFYRRKQMIVKPVKRQ